MQITPAATELHISQSRGVAPLVGVKTAPARADKAAPPAIIMALPSPEAAPARSGRMASIPAVALGILNPLPNPTKVMKPKKLIPDPMPL